MIRAHTERPSTVGSRALPLLTRLRAVGLVAVGSALVTGIFNLECYLVVTFRGVHKIQMCLKILRIKAFGNAEPLI
jgi:hypothetical protein